MTDTSRASTRCPPARQVRGTKLNTIMEEVSEGQVSGKLENNGTGFRSTTSGPQLKLMTAGLSSLSLSRLNRLRSPLSAGTLSSCSDTEWQRQMQTFDDLYDVTDEDSELSDECTSFSSSRPTSLTTPTTRNSVISPVHRNRYPSLTIPSSTTLASLHNAPKSSPVPPTPPPKIPVSPAALSMLARTVPALNAPPSLDGSVSSDQVSNSSEPVTPDLQSLPDTDWNAPDIQVRPEMVESQHVGIDTDEIDPEVQSIEIAIENPDEDWQHVLGSFPPIPSQSTLSSDGGVFLPEDALATLRHIPLGGTPEPWSETSAQNEEMWELELPAERPRSADDATPASALSGYSFSGLSIPSPGGFFASLGARARHTWSIPRTAMPPSSATAERFYNLPFGRDDGEVVEQIIECPERCTEEQLTAVPVPEGPPTAIKIPSEAPSLPLGNEDSPVSPGADAVHEISRPATYCESQDRDEDYEEELKKKAMSSLDRTSVWLAAQQSYLAALRETNPVNSLENEEPDGVERVRDDCEQNAPALCRKKSVRFAESVSEAARPPSALANKDSIYWRGFQSVLGRSTRRDSFIHRSTRFDAVQSIRSGLLSMHINCLLGNYELVRPERPPYKGPFSQAPRNSVLTSVLAEKAQFSILEKEQLVLSQLRPPMWAMDALTYLNGGHLVTSPARRRLSTATAQPAPPQRPRGRRVRVLDLGGHASCEWAWQLAHDYPNVKVYTVFTEHQAVNHGIKGPSNHCQIPVSQLWKLPFADNKFDLISARSLPALLKKEGPVGETQDEYDLCLQECRRCLKPGGYLEFFVMDAEISHAGPYASAASVEFAFNLKTRGYDPSPTKTFLWRLRSGGFVSVKRAWMFLPMGMEPAKAQLPRETPDPRVKSWVDEYEAVHGPVGSTADIASVTGLFGGWMWEQWLLKLQVEMGRERHRLLEGIGSVFDEGRKNGAGWTCLSGWAMKPKSAKPLSRL
ncbi:hypothetical protein CNMCM5793_001104 [Aspergillus hiratsukae]|uniref:Methyltransferase type 11 domain-containing protein n=1 Tax=Aspergillus hiratsukae TaxID=1194566 RepID=A0A8H6Q5X4_9EURO|nr:hypothetical protein CNMCM5793_001104 [Aspergillus hiratsukae]KAF7166284.1 hypothetical protein CNMCM6106_002142 [Aspergillus hiratsukae]